MGDYLAHLIGRSLGQGELLCPRPRGLFEPPPSTDSLIPPCHSHPETLEEQDIPIETTSDSPSAIPTLTKLKGGSRRSEAGVQGHLEAPYHQMGALHESSQHFLGQPTNLQQPLLKSVAPQSPESNSERRPSQPDQTLVKPEVSTITPRQEDMGPEHRVPQPDTLTKEMNSNQTALHTAPHESDLSSAQVARSTADTRTLTFQRPTGQQDEAKPIISISPEMKERPESLKALLPTPLPTEPQTTDAATTEADLRQTYITPHIEAKDEVSPQPIRKPAKEPIIQVTIGRIEVRAIMDPTPSPRTVIASEPKLSLDDYLKQHKAGQR